MVAQVPHMHSLTKFCGGNRLIANTLRTRRVGKEFAALSGLNEERSRYLAPRRATARCYALLGDAKPCDAMRHRKLPRSPG